ncbi:cytochrome b [Thiohalophilus sp.]|uniref:cytochrome b n=1 Tax=Thiohalophilus sp. TaxID=3028392 RepID=UPI002ACE27EB|nr:cytochrome b [Thiohalophilus sp.]MDZ7661151.1 cytochrome b [Thiohalophilus sp.]
MRLGNTTSGYGPVAIILHWLTALAVIGLFALGLWMVELTYYDSWYTTAPAIHKSVGLLLFVLVLLRLLWRWGNPHPEPIGPPLEKRLAGVMHWLLYLFLLAVLISGYLISTAKGKPIEVFDWFAVPASVHGLPNQEDIAGLIHLWLAWGLIVLSSGHTLAALKHHFFDRDATLRRILRST